MIEINKENLEDFINKKEIALLLIGAEWSGPFRQMKKNISQFEVNFNEIVNFGVSDSDYDSFLYDKYKTLCNPVIVLYHKGKLISVSPGPIDINETVKTIKDGRWGKKTFLDKYEWYLFYAISFILLFITIIWSQNNK